MDEYVMMYEYQMIDLGCGCCHDYESRLTVYESSRADEGVYTSSFEVGLMENEEELREYIAEHHPEYNDFVVHEDCRWF